MYHGIDGTLRVSVNEASEQTQFSGTCSDVFERRNEFQEFWVKELPDMDPIKSSKLYSN